jgi:hypothetical protein
MLGPASLWGLSQLRACDVPEAMRPGFRGGTLASIRTYLKNLRRTLPWLSKKSTAVDQGSRDSWKAENHALMCMRIWLLNLGPIWVRLAGSNNSLEDRERAVSTVKIQ